MTWALMVGIWTSVSHIIIISVYVPVKQPETPDLVVQVMMQSLIIWHSPAFTSVSYSL